MLEQREREDRTKVRWLRAAAKDGFDAIARGVSTSLHSRKAIKEFLREIREDEPAQFAPKGKCK